MLFKIPIAPCWALVMNHRTDGQLTVRFRYFGLMSDFGLGLDLFQPNSNWFVEILFSSRFIRRKVGGQKRIKFCLRRHWMPPWKIFTWLTSGSLTGIWPVVSHSTTRCKKIASSLEDFDRPCNVMFKVTRLVFGWRTFQPWNFQTLYFSTTEFSTINDRTANL